MVVFADKITESDETRTTATLHTHTHMHTGMNVIQNNEQGAIFIFMWKLIGRKTRDWVLTCISS